MATESVRVFILESHPAIRAGLRALLESAPDIVVVGEAATAAATLAEIGALRPDIILLDPNVPESGGLPLIKELSAVVPAASLLVHTDDGAPAIIQAAYAAGVRGYLLKGQRSQQLVQTIRILFASQTNRTTGEERPD